MRKIRFRKKARQKKDTVSLEERDKSQKNTTYSGSIHTARTRKFSKGVKLFIFFLSSFAFMVIGFGSYFTSRDINVGSLAPGEIVSLLKEEIFDKESTSLYSEIKFDPGMNVSFGIYRDYILEVSKYGLRFLDKKGKEKYSSLFTMNNPIVRSSGPFIGVADIGGKSVCLFNGSQKIWEKTMENSIVNFDVGSQGNVLIVHEEERYKAAVTSFDSEGRTLFNLGKAENYITNCKISPTGDSMVLVEVNTQDSKLSSVIEFSTIFGKFDPNRIQISNTIVATLGYLNDGSVAVAGDREIKIYDRNKMLKLDQNMNGKLFGADICDGKFLIIGGSYEELDGLYNNNKTVVKIFEKDRLKTQYAIEDQIKSISTSKTNIAATGTKSVYLSNIKGKAIGRFESIQDIRGVNFFNDSELLVTGKTSAFVVKIN